MGSTSASGNTEPGQRAETPPERENPEPAPQESAAESRQAAPAVADDEAARYGRNETARNPNIDPGPESNLQPGETPPESNSATATPPGPGTQRTAAVEGHHDRCGDRHRSAAGTVVLRLHCRTA
ncbi:hypothetical protein GCM10009771_04570 [Nesterenkonia flava]|uniref:Uncharacterized protein n=1 Tax=Nesterenkonia flava TaxID=469799 RepID=A0ABU1FSK3_9MICC|nr:hypothetical protein [Nesterenkonia flava]